MKQGLADLISYHVVRISFYSHIHNIYVPNPPCHILCSSVLNWGQISAVFLSCHSWSGREVGVWGGGCHTHDFHPGGWSLVPCEAKHCLNQTSLLSCHLGYRISLVCAPGEDTRGVGTCTLAVDAKGPAVRQERLSSSSDTCGYVKLELWMTTCLNTEPLLLQGWCNHHYTPVLGEDVTVITEGQSLRAQRRQVCKEESMMIQIIGAGFFRS